MQEEVPVEAWLRGSDREISREEENTVILQLDILRSIHIDLHNVGQVRDHQLLTPPPLLLKRDNGILVDLTFTV